VVTINTASAIIMRALGVDIQHTIVGVTTYITENSKFWPKLNHKPAFKFTNLNYEQLAELNPQLIILYKNSSQTTNENKLTALGIKWLYLDCNDPRTMDEDIRTLGRLFGKEEQAESLIAWRGRYARLIANRIGTIAEKQRVPVYFYPFIYSYLNKQIYRAVNQKASFHPMIQHAGGINISADFPQENMQVSGEWLLEQNPKAIVGGVISKEICGYNADENTAVANLKTLYQQLIADPVFKGTKAVKQNRVLLISQDLKAGPATVIGTLYLAKFLYPDKFDDIDPGAVLREYHKIWCGLDSKGVYIYPPQPQNSSKKIHADALKK
jgi:iron complex transport system substrate-binding protein